jgi:hypothetical protein
VTQPAPAITIWFVFMRRLLESGMRAESKRASGVLALRMLELEIKRPYAQGAARMRPGKAQLVEP